MRGWEIRIFITFMPPPFAGKTRRGRGGAIKPLSNISEIHRRDKIFVSLYGIKLRYNVEWKWVWRWGFLVFLEFIF